MVRDILVKQVRLSLDEAKVMWGYHDTLRTAGVTGRVLGHPQRRFVSPEGDDYLIRFAEDRHRAERMRLAEQLEMLLRTEQRHELLRNARTPAGEVCFVCVLPTDLLGDLIDELDPRGDVLTLAAPVTENGVFTTQIGSGDSPEFAAWTTMDRLGWTRETTVSDVMLGMGNHVPADRALITA